MSRRLTLCAVAAVALTLVCAPAAFAASVAVVAPDYAAGTVQFAAEHPAGTASMVLKVDGVETQVLPVAADAVRSVTNPFALRTNALVTVEGRDASGGAIWTSSIMADAAAYRPTIPLPGVAWKQIVPSKWDVAARVSRPVTELTITFVRTGDSRTVHQSAPASGVVGIPAVVVPYGPAKFRLQSRNGFGDSPVSTWYVYNLGDMTKLPRSTRYCVVDKESMRLYHVYGGAVLRHFPIAIGMPSAPTPNGTFRVGPRKPAPNAVWGVLRRRLARKTASGWVATSFYIHGTNAPWSIGMMVSHGCVRMTNTDIRAFAKTVPDGTIVRIR